MKKIALTGGGTAGHITPNLALVPELKKRNYEIIYIGSKRGMENEIINRHKLPYFIVPCSKLRRYADLRNIFMPFVVLIGIIKSIQILKEEKVSIVFSKGGFVAVPVVIGAFFLGIPVISHESDISPGLANKLSAPFSKKVCTSFNETASSFGKKGVHTGCPIRDILKNGDKEKGKKFLDFNNDKPILFVTGGSLGSKYINDLILKNLDKLLSYTNIVHSCGKGKLTGTKKEGYKEFELIRTEMPDILAASDFVISRAGANIIFELLALNKPNLLIPLSTKVSRGDQILNAKSFENKNYSVVLYEEEQDNDSSMFFNKLTELSAKEQLIKESMAKANKIDAVHLICDLIDNYVKK